MRAFETARRSPGTGASTARVGDHPTREAAGGETATPPETYGLLGSKSRGTTGSP